MSGGLNLEKTIESKKPTSEYTTDYFDILNGQSPRESPNEGRKKRSTANLCPYRPTDTTTSNIVNSNPVLHPKADTTFTMATRLREKERISKLHKMCVDRLRIKSNVWMAL